MKHSKFDIIKEIIWTLFLYVLYYGYCFVMLMLIHLITYSIFDLNWTIKTILIAAFAGSTFMIGYRVIRLNLKKKKNEIRN